MLLINRLPFIFSLFLISQFVASEAMPKGLDLTAKKTALSTDALKFSANKNFIPSAEDCYPVFVTSHQVADIHYLQCSKERMEKDHAALKINDELTVPKELAARFNFWRRVYGLWSKDQYILHVGEFPEVVLEVWDLSRFQYDKKGLARASKILKDDRQKTYYQLLIALNDQRKTSVENLEPALKRIAELMAHIKREDKYLVAAQSLRSQRGQREYIQNGITVASKYMPMIEQEFVKYKVPKSYAKLAFIESSFNLMARSKVGASGVFQIMPQTGRQYLILQDGIDERNDPIKSAKAAAKLLLLNYNILGKWPLAVTAYNHGVGGIRRAMDTVRSNELTDLIDRYDGANFGFASKNFYAGYLGLVFTLENIKTLFPKAVLAEPMQFSSVNVGGLSAMEAQQKYKLSGPQILSMNPDISWTFLKYNSVFKTGYSLKIPGRMPTRLLASKSPRKPSAKR